MTNDRESAATKARVAALYNRVSSEYGRGGRALPSVAGERLVAITGVAAGWHVLDVACGRGASLLPAARTVQPGGLVAGIDLARQMVRRTRDDTRALGLSNTHFVQADGEAVPFPANSFDAVLCGFAVFLFPNPANAVEEWGRVLRQGGIVGIYLASAGDPRWAWYEELLLAYQRRHGFALNANPDGVRRLESIQALLENAGFSEISIRTEPAEHTYTSETEWWRSKWSHGARVSLEAMGQQVLAEFEREVRAQLAGMRSRHGLSEKWELAYIVAKR